MLHSDDDEHMLEGRWGGGLGTYRHVMTSSGVDRRTTDLELRSDGLRGESFGAGLLEHDRDDIVTDVTLAE